MKHLRSRLALLLIPVAVGCSSRQRYVRPRIPLPDTFNQAVASTASPFKASAWWRSFGDPGLNALVDLALARNPDLAAAGIRVRRAGLQARLANNALLPQLNGNTSTGITRPFTNAVSPSSPVPASPDTTSRHTSGTLGVSWEADLFGRLSAQRDAARFESEATAEDRDAVALSLVGTSANLYWQIGFANERIALGEESLAHARQTSDLVRLQYAAGTVSTLEIRDADEAIETQVAAQSQLVQIRTEAQDELMVLLDGFRWPGPEPEKLTTTQLPAVDAGLPVELLGRRPDLRAAELRLRSAFSEVNAARANYYPTLALTSALNTASTGLLGVLANPTVTLGMGDSLPFLNIREVRFSTASARAQYEEAVVNFRKSLYTALSEVENALSARRQLALQGEALERARDDSVVSEKLYEVRYRAGAIPLRLWLDAQERRRAADISLSANRLARLQNQATLYQVLGGGTASSLPY